MLNDVTLRDFEDRSQLVQLRDRDTVQCAHCALEKSQMNAARVTLPVLIKAGSVNI